MKYSRWSALLLSLSLSLSLAACSLTRTPEKADDWQQEVLVASDCGLEGLACCADRNKSCEEGLMCCTDSADVEKPVCAQSCDCGAAGQFCCGGEKCGDGLSCFRGRCEICGGKDQACCAGETCSEDTLGCQEGRCETCGLIGGPCCSFADACASASSTRSACFSKMCAACGSLGQPACLDEPACDAGALPNNGACLSCGAYNQPCCQGGLCSGDGLECFRGFCGTPGESGEQPPMEVMDR